MATINITKKFKNLLPQTNRFRAQVLVVDNTLNRIKVQWGASQLWVTAIPSLAVNDQVLVEENRVITKLPELPYTRVEIT